MPWGDVKICDSVRHGAHTIESEAPNNTTTGTPNAAATCAGPLSLPTKREAPDIKLLTSVKGALRQT